MLTVSSGGGLVCSKTRERNLSAVLLHGKYHVFHSERPCHLIGRSRFFVIVLKDLVNFIL